MPRRRSIRRLHVPPRRGGFTLLEITVATAMIVVLLATLGQLVVLVKRHVRSSDDHALALRTVENCLEAVAHRPWDEIIDGPDAAPDLPAAVTELWPQAALTLAVAPSSDPVESKRVSLELRLSPEARAPGASLTTWLYRAPR